MLLIKDGIIMLFLRIYLKNYKRIALNGVTELEYTPEKRLQIILGTNGCGKSSLLKELSVIPTSRTDYNKGGYKEVEVSHNKTYYKLISNYDTGSYSFLLNGDTELNTGHTRSSQINLAYEHFGITPQIQDLMNNTSHFTNMSIAERKYWFSVISDDDHSYGLSVYKELLSRLRDVKGSIKITSSRIADESSKLLKEQDLVNLTQDHTNLLDELDYLLQNKKQISMSSQDVNKNLEYLYKQKDKLLRAIEEIKNRYPKIGDLDTIELSKSEGVLSSSLSTVKDDIDKINLSITELQDKVGSDNYKASDIKTLTERQSVLKTGIDNIKKEVSINLDINLPVFIQLWLSNIESLQTSIEALMDINRDVDTSVTIESITTQIKALSDDNEDKLTSLKQLEERNKLSIEITKQGITCSNCGKPVIIELGTDDADKYIDEVSGLINNNDKEIEKLNKVLELVRSRISLQEHISSILSTINSLNVSEELTEASRDIIGNIFKLNQIVSRINNDISQIERYIKLKEEYEDNSISLSKTDTEKEKYVLDIKNEITNKKEQLLSLFKKQDNLEKEYKEILDTKDILRRYNDYKDQYTDIAKSKIPELESLKKDYENNFRINKEITTLRNNITVLENKIQANSNISAIIKDMETQLSELKESKIVLEAMVKGLSPTEGLIGESISNSMHSLIDTMNSIIARIWSYPLEVQSCILDPEEIDLSYKFPVKVENGFVSDISKTSSSMQEIINLSFRIAVMNKLGLTPYPLYLDEFGSSFDSVHRETAYRAIIDDLLSSTEFSQIFMVSHFIGDYGSIYHADMNVIGSTNIELPNHDNYTSMLRTR